LRIRQTRRLQDLGEIRFGEVKKRIKTELQEDGGTDPRRVSLKGFYFIGIAATAIGIGVVMLLNMATPLEFILDQLGAADEGKVIHWGQLIGKRLFGLGFLIIISCPLLLLGMHSVLRPISDYLKLIKAGQEAPVDLFQRAKRRLINLPFIMMPLNVGLWILLPAALFYSAYATGRIDSVTALTIALRSTMVGFISAAITSFWIESHARRQLIPLFFPKGRLIEVKGAVMISISKRIRAFYRIGSLIPLVILVITLLTLQWQVESMEISAKEYGRGILVFSIVLSGVFFFGSSVLNKLISRSIVGPVDNILAAVTKVKGGDYGTKVAVVANDEIGILGDATNEMIQGLAERELLRETFGKYVTPEIRDEILSGRIPLDGELKEVTILFADLRDFTPMTESNNPKLVTKILNSYFKEMGEAIQIQSGLVLQFLGDEIYAVFGAPIFLSDHPVRAFKAALSMCQKLINLNNLFSEKGWPTLRHGIGIHTGEVVAANIGSPDRLSYLLVGDTVNLASRLQSLTKETGTEIILSADTCARLTKSEMSMAELKRLPPVSVKGKSHPIEIFAVA